MANEEIRFGPDDHIVFLLIRRTRSAECATLTGFERYLESDALCVVDDPSVAGCVAALLDEDYRYGGAGEDYPGGATSCAVLDLTYAEQVRAYADLNDRKEWKDRPKRRALQYGNECRAVKSWTVEQASGKSKEGHPAAVPRSLSGNVAPTLSRAVKSEHDDYKPAAWFARYTNIPAPRLRKAARPGRKHKKVRMTVIDGRPHYHAGDAKRWWESDFHQPNRS